MVTDLVTGLHPPELARDIDIISWLPAPRSTTGSHLPVRTFVDHSFRGIAHGRLALSVDARAGLPTEAYGWYDLARPYRLYHPAADPKFVVSFTPVRISGCVSFQVQRRYAGGWRGVTEASCAPITNTGNATWRLRGKQATNAPYRVRPGFAGDSLNEASTGDWIYFKFVRQ